VKRAWVTKDGQRLRIRAMETSHIVNCVKMIRRYQDHLVAQLAGVGSMLHGEIAQDDFDQHFEQLLEEGFPEEDLTEQYIYAFQKELERRGHEIPYGHDVP
jgi:hypothetical protein